MMKDGKNICPKCKTKEIKSGVEVSPDGQKRREETED